MHWRVIFCQWLHPVQLELEFGTCLVVRRKSSPWKIARKLWMSLESVKNHTVWKILVWILEAVPEHMRRNGVTGKFPEETYVETCMNVVVWYTWYLYWFWRDMEILKIEPLWFLKALFFLGCNIMSGNVSICSKRKNMVLSFWSSYPA